MKKCGKNSGYLNEIEKIQMVPHFRNKYSAYMQNYLRLREYTLPTFTNSRIGIKMLQKLRLPREVFMLSDFIIYCKIKEFSSYSSSI